MSYDETLYARFITGELTEKEIEELKENGDWEALNKIVADTDMLSLNKWDVEKGFNDLKDRRSNKSEPKTFKLTPKLIWPVAASLLLCIAAVFLLMPNETVITADNSQAKKITLKDASIVQLNDGSSLKYKEKGWLENRKVELTGEAYFEIEKGGDFEISTSNGNVRVLGTKFTVRAWNDVLYVECYSGKVEVSQGDKVITLLEKQSINFTNKSMPRSATVSNESPMWMEGISQFYDESFNTVFDEIARQYNITIEKPNLENRFSGNFTHDNLEVALQKVCLPLNLKYELSSNNTKVTISK